MEGLKDDDVIDLTWHVMVAYDEDTDEYMNAARIRDEMFPVLRGDRPVKIKIINV
jgi:hypothetical protein